MLSLTGGPKASAPSWTFQGPTENLKLAIVTLPFFIYFTMIYPFSLGKKKIGKSLLLLLKNDLFEFPE